MQGVYIIYQLSAVISYINYQITTTLLHIILYNKNLKIINLTYVISILNHVFIVIFYATR
jgi:hypothetical protein